MEDFWFPRELREFGSAPTGTQTDEFIFLSAQSGLEWSTGRLPTSIWDMDDVDSGGLGLLTGLEHRDGREGPVQAQTVQALRNIKAILEERGSSLGSVVRQRVYVANHHDIPAVQRAMTAIYAKDPLPATNICQSGGDGRRGDELVWVDVIALTDDARPEQIRMERYAGASGDYPAATLAHGLAFTSGLRGISPSSGLLALGPADVPDDVAEAVYRGSSWERWSQMPLKAQVGCIYDSLRELLGLLDVDSSQLLKTNYMTYKGMNEWGAAVISPRALLYGDRPRPANTSLCVPAVDSMGSEVSVDGVIAAAGTSVERHAGEEIAMANLDMAVSGGDDVFTTGYVGMDKELHGPIQDPADLKFPEGRLLAAGCRSAREQLRAQAWHTYRWLDRILAELGSEGGKVVQQTIYIRDLDDVPETLALCRAAFGDRVPPTTVVGVQDIGPYPGLLLEVDVIAVRSA